MRRLFTLFAILLAVVTSSCSKFDDSAIWDKLNEQEQTLNDHEKRIAALEELCRQLNTNIDALQTIVEALEKKDYVTNVSPVREDGEIVGYTISFANSDTITIYNGKDGVDGTDGKDGYTPQIGVMKDTDGIYYWTVDGEWLLDGKGDKIKAIGEDGRDGQDGTNGVDGIDGIAPRLKIENDYWYVSYDGGATWTELGKATGEDGADGSDGTDGEDGDSIFSSVTQDDEYVYFNLADGTMITLPKHDKENIQFEDLQVKAICCKNWDTNNDGELSYAEAASVLDIDTVFNGNKDIIAFTELKYFTGLAYLPEEAFLECTNLWKIIIPENVTIIMNKAFKGCNSLVNINVSNKITTIGSEAFYGCSELRDITLHESITNIGSKAFYGCSELRDITLHESITNIGGLAFYGCKGKLYINCPIPDYTSSSSSSSSPYYGSSFSEIIIGDGVTYIGNSAFAYSSPKKVTIGQNVTSIGDQAFYYIKQLTDIVISDNVTTIGRYCFYDSFDLRTLTIGKGVTRIEPYAFDGCSGLETIYCRPITPPNIDLYTSNSSYRVFPYDSLIKIYVPSESYAVYIEDRGASGNQSSWYSYRNYMVPYNFE